MAKTLYTWDVTHHKRMPDGTVKPITLKQTGPKPPKGAKNVRPAAKETPDPAFDVQAPADVDIQAGAKPAKKKAAKKS